jgi:hypothetical protein
VHGKPFEPDERMQDPRGRRRGRQRHRPHRHLCSATRGGYGLFQDSSPDVVAFVLTFDRLAGSRVVREQPIPRGKAFHPFGVMTRFVRTPYAE